MSRFQTLKSSSNKASSDKESKESKEITKFRSKILTYSREKIEKEIKKFKNPFCEDETEDETKERKLAGKILKQRLNELTIGEVNKFDETNKFNEFDEFDDFSKVESKKKDKKDNLFEEWFGKLLDLEEKRIRLKYEVDELKAVQEISCDDLVNTIITKYMEHKRDDNPKHGKSHESQSYYHMFKSIKNGSYLDDPIKSKLFQISKLEDELNKEEEEEDSHYKVNYTIDDDDIDYTN